LRVVRDRIRFRERKYKKWKSETLATQKTTIWTRGEVCPHCDHKIFPPRDVCPNCGDEAKEQFAFSGKGEVYSYTTVYEAPAGFDANAPYTVAIVKLEEGPCHRAVDRYWRTANFNRHAREMVTRKMRNDGDERGVIVYGYKFRPAQFMPTK